MGKDGLNASATGGSANGAGFELKPQVFNVRGKRVVLDREVAAYVGIDTKYLKKVVRRNYNFFEDDNFVFELTQEELLQCQNELQGDKFVSLNKGRGSNIKYLPFAFTAEGVSMLEKVLKRSIPIEFGEEIAEVEVLPESWSEGTVVLYQPNDNIKIDVRVENETVWLTQEQMAMLFGTTTQNITIHIGNIFYEKEVEERATCKDFLQVQIEGDREVRRNIKLYNLDIIISVGYRVKSIQGTRFRQWALKIIKGTLLHRHYYDSRIDKMEHTISDNTNRIKSLEQKIELVVDTKLPPTEMVFYEGENFKAYDFLCTLIESAQKRIILIDNYVDRKTLMMLNKRAKGVSATVYTNHRTLSDPQIQLDFTEANKKREAPLIKMLEIKNDHDRFLIIDETVYHLGPSVKDAGVNRCAIIKMDSSPEKVMKIWS